MHTLKPVKFFYNRPLTFRKRKADVTPKDKAPSFRVSSSRTKWGDAIDKNIQTYRMWFMFLKLALELEEQNAVLVMRRKNIKGSKKDAVVKKKVVVNKKIYKEWDLDEVLKTHFDDWWKTHKYLFQESVVDVLREGDYVREEPGYLSIRINTQRRLGDIYQTLKKLVGKQKRHKAEARFKVNSVPRPLSLQNKYNALLLKLENSLSDKEILDLDKKYLRVSDARISRGYQSAHKSRLMFGLISGSKTSYGAKQILLSVCDGYFVKNPKDDYLS